MKFTEEQKKVIYYASYKELFIWLWWSIFYPAKSKKLLEAIDRGMHFRAAFNLAKNT
jgi:hypothetical protein